ncbi:hypothetical protein BWK60_11425 [Flavobacterium covae]|uniref:hypothetical protein n=1 Tax=Flavobacterium columnare TaxID=996 RepID=UPI000B4D8D23|nr:hypothetical protein [Flavobacterium columnare]MCH4830220.1 hypothetical protein [Flavobacterium columnare]MCH4832397.1 hypothetical protein [Flavobacterium columnare]OWP85943.1 hypothetical protein BWK60_11425 [Flavobacterium covae]
MRKSVLFVILTFNTISCKSQKTEEIIKTTKKDSMEYFSEEKYKDWKLTRKIVLQLIKDI